MEKSTEEEKKMAQSMFQFSTDPFIKPVWVRGKRQANDSQTYGCMMN